MKKNQSLPDGNPAHGSLDRREEMLELCYNRLKELIPECTSEVNLLKCIEILEKQGHASAQAEGEAALSVITDTLDRLAALRR